MSVYKDTKRETWYFSVRIKGKQYVRRGFKLRKDAINAERDFVSEKENDSFSHLSPTLTFDLLIPHYLVDYKSLNKYVSYLDTKSIIENHIEPYFLGKKVDCITPVDINNWHKAIRDKEYSKAYSEKIHVTLSTIFNHARRYFNNQLINPCEIAGNIKVKEKPKDPLDFYTKEEFIQFLSAVEDYEHRVMFHTFFYTGPRPGELRALRWKDFNEKNMELSYKHTIQKTEEGKMGITSPKTPWSERTNPIDSITCSHLVSLKKIAVKGGKYAPEHFIFGGNGFISKTTFQRIYDSYQQESKAKKIPVKNFRHSFASYMINLGATPKELASLMGHKNEEQVIKTYGFLYPDAKRKIIDRIEKDSLRDNTVITKVKF